MPITFTGSIFIHDVTECDSDGKEKKGSATYRLSSQFWLFSGNRDCFQSFQVMYFLYGFKFETPLMIFGSANILPNQTGDNICIRIFDMQFTTDSQTTIPSGIVSGTEKMKDVRKVTRQSFFL